MSNDRPIFIVGAPRSGTSLLRNMLNRQSAIHICDETHFFYKVWIRRRAFGDVAVVENRRRVVSQFIKTRAIKALDLDCNALAHALVRDGESYPALFAALLRETARQRGKSRFGEKTPRHALFSTTLCDWFPHCTLIHIVRDPRDVAASLTRVPFGSKDALANARTWLTHVRGASHARARPNYLQVKYEALVQDPEAEMRRVLSSAGEEFAPALLEAAQSEGREVAWWFQRAAAPLERNRVGAWRGQLDSREQAIVEWAAGPDMEDLGYAREAQPPSLAQRAAAVAGVAAQHALTRAANLGTLWHYWVRQTDLAGEEAAWAKREAETRMSAGARLSSMLDKAQDALARSAAARYGLAAAAPLLALALRALLDPVALPGSYYFIYVPAILWAAYALGFGPGLVSTAVAGVSSYLLFSQPDWPAAFDLRVNLRLALFLATSAGLVYLAARLGDRLRRLQHGGLGASPHVAGAAA